MLPRDLSWYTITTEYKLGVLWPWDRCLCFCLMPAGNGSSRNTHVHVGEGWGKLEEPPVDQLSWVIEVLGPFFISCKIPTPLNCAPGCQYKQFYRCLPVQGEIQVIWRSFPYSLIRPSSWGQYKFQLYWPETDKSSIF